MGVWSAIKTIIMMMFVLFVIACLSTIFLGDPGAVFSKVIVWIQGFFQ